MLGRRPAAQPPALVFGGQPDPRDYGRTLADGAVLIFIGTAGLLTRMHESSSDAAMLSMLLIAMYAMARSLERPIPGALWMAAALIGLGLSAGLLLGLTVGLAWLALLLIHPDLRAARIDFVRLTAPLTLAGLLIWPALAWWLLPDGAAYLDNLTQYRAGTFGLVPVSALAIYAKNLGWYTWPAWPLAAWGVWSWRHHIATAHMAFPLALLMATGTTLLLGTDFSEANMLALLPALTVLATFGLPTLKRGAANGIDWFSLMIFSCAALLIWLGWVAMTTGFPPKIAANFARQTAGFLPGFNAGAFVLALLASVAWIVLVHWRLSRHPKSLWRSVVLSAAGLTLSWFLLMSLWLPSINYSKTYRVVASQLAGLVRDDACLQSENLGLAQRASFAYFSGLHFAPIAIDGSQPECAFLLRQDHQRQILPTQPAATHGTGWEQIWEGQRPSDRDERFRLYRRAVQPSMASTPK